MRLALLVTLMLGLPAARADAGRGTALLKYLPDDTNVVVVADVARARGSKVFKRLLAIAREQNAWLDDLATSMPIEKQVDTVVMGMTTAKQAVTVLEGRVDKLFAEAKKQSTKQETHDGIAYLVTEHGELALVDKKLVLTSAGAMTAVIDRRKAKKAKGPAAVRTILAATTPNTAVFGGIVLDTAQRSDFKTSLGAEPQWVAFSFAMAQKLTIDVRPKLASEADAAAVVKKLADELTPERRGQLEGFVGKEFSDSITVDQQNAFARFAATMTLDELEKIITFAKVLL